MLDSSGFKYAHKFDSKNLLLKVMNLIIKSYSKITEIKVNVDHFLHSRENQYRSDLVIMMNKLKSHYGLSGLIINSEPEEYNEGNLIGLIDIKIQYCQPNVICFEDDWYHSIECKKLDKYLNFSNCYADGVEEFIIGKYSRNTDYAAMIYFIEEFEENGTIEKIVEKWNNYLIKKFTGTLSKFNHEYEFIYCSKHERINDLNDIKLFHLMLDYSEIYNLNEN